MANIRFVKPPPDNRIRSFPFSPPQIQEVPKDVTMKNPLSLDHFTINTKTSESLSNTHHTITSSFGDCRTTTTSATNPCSSCSTSSPSSTTSNSDRDENVTIHITTPKRRKDHIPQWDIFITSRPQNNNNDNNININSNNNNNNNNNKNGGSDSNKTVGVKTSASNVSSSNCFQSRDLPNKTNSSNYSMSNSSSDAKLMEFESNQELAPTDPGTRDPLFFHQPLVIDIVEKRRIMSKKVHEKTDIANDSNKPEVCVDNKLKATNTSNGDGRIGQQKHIKNKKDTVTSEPSSSPEARLFNKSPSRLNSSENRLTTSSSSGGNNEVSVGLSEVSEEELLELPDVCEPTGCVVSTDLHKKQQKVDIKHHSEDRVNKKALQEHEPTRANVSKRSESTQNLEKALDPNVTKWIGLPKRPYPLGPLRRSFSEYTFMYANDDFEEDEEEDVSFFARMKASHGSNLKRQAADSSDPLSEATDTKRGVTNHRPPRLAWMERVVRDSSFFGGSDTALQPMERLGHGSHRNPPTSASEGNSGSSTPVESLEDSLGTLLKSKSDSHGFQTRLWERRCALADPEKMIISQELREKIERDIKKRKSSAVRKVSQFFNVQLGLNREEDLI